MRQCTHAAVRANTNVTTMMIAEWAVDRIKEGRCIPAAVRCDQTSNP
jgi:choline dehydrogenase-like flavoprotein